MMRRFDGQEIDRPYHPVANLFPLLQGEEFESLKRDIQENGQREPVWLDPSDGSIIDGRNRHRALIELEEPIKFQYWEGESGTILNFALSLNLHRRHLTASQKAAIALEILPMLEMQAQQRMLSTLKWNQGTAGEKIPQQEQGRAREQAAALVGVNAHYVSDAKKIAAAAPELIEDVRAGSLTLTDAKELVKLPVEQRERVRELVDAGDGTEVRDAIEQVVRADRRLERVERINQISRGNRSLETDRLYPVIYIDPPWRYEHPISDSRAIENQYPTMELAEILELPVAKIASNPAVLFCWATSPKLYEAMLCLTQWGFLYRSCIVWDKEIQGMGYYARQQHELLLIAVRGDMPVPEPANRPPSVMRIRRSEEHSEKPAEFRQLIERMYPEYDRIELFARSAPEGWAVWGNQAE